MNIHDVSFPILDVTFLIGSDHPELLLHQFKIGKPGESAVVETKLGWMLM